MSTIKLYGLRGSTCTRRVLAVLEETGLPYEFYRVDWDGLEHKSPVWIATKQPFGRIPVLSDGEYQIYESRAIARYLASAYDKTGTLYPSDPKVRGKIEQWISVEQSYYVAAEDLVVQVIFTPMKGGVPDQLKVQDAETRLNHVLGIIDNHLATSQFFVGDNFTVADIVFMPYTNMLMKFPHYVEFYGKYKNFMRWWQQVSTRPSWQRIAAQSEFNF